MLFGFKKDIPAALYLNVWFRPNAWQTAGDVLRGPCERCRPCRNGNRGSGGHLSEQALFPMGKRGRKTEWKLCTWQSTQRWPWMLRHTKCTVFRSR